MFLHIWDAPVRVGNLPHLWKVSRRDNLAIARFILYDSEGLETVNRLVETDLKSALVQGKSISGGGGTSHS
jgi:hypothetical protein